VDGEFTIEYVELPNGQMPAREFVDSLDDKAAARTDAFCRAPASGFWHRLLGKR
jgi:hypothetical protein